MQCSSYGGYRYFSKCVEINVIIRNAVLELMSNK